MVSTRRQSHAKQANTTPAIKFENIEEGYVQCSECNEMGCYVSGCNTVACPLMSLHNDKRLRHFCFYCKLTVSGPDKRCMKCPCSIDGEARARYQDDKKRQFKEFSQETRDNPYDVDAEEEDDDNVGSEGSSLNGDEDVELSYDESEDGDSSTTPPGDEGYSSGGEKHHQNKKRRLDSDEESWHEDSDSGYQDDESIHERSSANGNNNMMEESATYQSTTPDEVKSQDSIAGKADIVKSANLKEEGVSTDDDDEGSLKPTPVQVKQDDDIMKVETDDEGGEDPVINKDVDESRKAVKWSNNPNVGMHQKSKRVEKMAEKTTDDEFNPTDLNGDSQLHSTRKRKEKSDGTNKKCVRKQCSVEGCTNYVLEGGVCMRHGGKVKTCSHEGCTNIVVKGGVCWRHGAKGSARHGAKRKTCKHEGCTSHVVNGGVCVKHGAKVKTCSHEGCTNYVVKGEFVSNMEQRGRLANMRDVPI